jgi:segregation and condensation protein B
MSLKTIHEAILRLQGEYETKHHGLRLQEVAAGYQFRTKATYSRYVQDLFKVNSLVLGQSAIEVLAIIAWRQPVARMEIDRIRGVDSSHLVRLLMDKRLVKITGRSEEMGRPVLYGTTLEFLEVFGLQSIEALPPERELEELAQDKDQAKISDIKAIVGEAKQQFLYDETAEVAELRKRIQDIATDTDFTFSLRKQDNKRTDVSVETPEPVISAFDLLEEFVLKQTLIKRNELAATSELVTTVASVSVVHLPMEGYPNGPEVGEEVLLDATEDAAIESFDAESPEDCARSLEEAIDDAFNKLSNVDIDADEDFGAIKNSENGMRVATSTMIEQGKELDIDLSFMDKDKEN